jgi:hypothetical protein
MGATQRSLQAQSHLLKKLSEHKSTNRSEKILKKSIFSTSEVKICQK